MMRALQGYYRLCLVGLTLGLAATFTLFTAALPLQFRGIRLSGWVVTLAGRAIFRIMNVSIHCPDREALREHDGFIFPNHVSYADILALSAVAPARYLAKAEVRSMPLIGFVAWGIGTVFVNRDDKESRALTRKQLAELDHFPPVALFPEGRRGAGDELLPFRHGAFDIAINGRVPFLPCVIVYEGLEYIIWHRGESLIKAAWRLATRSELVRAHVIPLPVVVPGAGHSAPELSAATRAEMSAVIQEWNSTAAEASVPHVETQYYGS